MALYSHTTTQMLEADLIEKKLSDATIINSDNIFVLYYKNNFYKIMPELLEDFLKLFDIDNVRIISHNKISDIKGIKMYYYNYDNEYFME